MNILGCLFSRLGAKVKRDNKIGFLGDRLPDDDDQLDIMLNSMEPDPPNYKRNPGKKLDIIVMGKEKRSQRKRKPQR